MTRCRYCNVGNRAEAGWHTLTGTNMRVRCERDGLPEWPWWTVAAVLAGVVALWALRGC